MINCCASIVRKDGVIEVALCTLGDRYEILSTDSKVFIGLECEEPYEEARYNRAWSRSTL